MERFDVAVIGGGLAGWAAAATAARAGATVVVVDRDGVGGRAATDPVGRFHINRGAHALYDSGPGVAVLRSLGIEPRGGRPPVRGALGRIGDDLHLLPTDAGSIMRTPLLGARGKLQTARLLARLKRLEPSSVAHLSIDDWLDELDLRDDDRAVIAALIRLSSYAADHDRISADVAVTQLRLATKGVLYLHGGWNQLIDGLADTATRSGARRLAATANAVDSSGSSIEVETTEGAVVADRIVLAVGGPTATANLLGHTPDSWREVGPVAQVSCLDVGVDRGASPPLVIGIDQPLYANSHAVARLAPEGAFVVHAMRYLRSGEPWNPDEGRGALEEHLSLAGVAPETIAESRYLHRMTVTSAMPVPESGGMAGRPSVTSTGDDRVLVAGDWVGPEGNLADTPLTSGAAAGRLAVGRTSPAVAS
ncbi:MAG: FAD-dependent oxidoreductase [Acidimicrobiales bacterium]